jgi:DNA-directed RNA polymerase I, II, and III subunit RPABC1
MNFYTSARNNPTDQIFVFFSEEKSVGVKTMRKFVTIVTSALCCAHAPFVRLLGILEEKSIQRGIIVFPGNMTPSARKVRHSRSPDIL